MHETTPGFLTVRQRRLAWLGFLLLAVQAPVSALLLPDDSWMFSVVVSVLIAVAILADDAMRRQAAATGQGNLD
jgi:hypothetical protein